MNKLSNFKKIYIFLIIALLSVFYVKNKTYIENFDNNIVCFKQNDDLWKNDKLGESEFNMKNSGCLTSCIASALNMQFVKINEINEITPKTLNKFFSENNVYDNEGNIQWEIMEKCLNVNVVREDTINKEEIKKLLNNNIFPIVKIRIDDIGAFHYVLIADIQDDEFLCMDPLKGEVVLMKNKIYAVRYIVDKLENQ